MRDELDDMLSSQKMSQAKDDEIAALKRQLHQIEVERNGYLKKCQDYEKRLEEEESRYWQLQNGRPTVDQSRPSAAFTTAADRIQQRLVQEAQDDHLGELFNQIDQTEMNSFLDQTQTAVENIEKHVRGLAKYQNSIQTLYDQLKQTAQFLAEIVHSLGLNDEHVELIIQKINKLQLSIQETGEISAKLANDTQHIVAELSVVSMRIEQSLRTSMIEPIQSSVLEPSRNNQALEEMTAKNQLLADSNKELVEKERQLSSEVKALQKQIEKICLEKETFERQLDGAVKSKKEFGDKYTNMVNLLTERDEELENRKFIIEELRIEADKQKVPPGLENEISDRLQAIYNTMSDITSRLRK
ncbi:hypothetical protein M3Y97_00142300 [Aphelenchoides bicaudatus]|nr:hypothetical protein M3Y97_00142300 [Aphelenchoides bicaudatus]